MTRTRLLACAFPVLLWLTAFLFLGGATGWWADDYYNNQRLADGSLPALNLSWKWPMWSLGVRREFFIRPLMYQVAPAVTTLLWHHSWVAHVLQAAGHAGVVWLAWRLMRVLGISRAAATLAAMLFLVYPAPYEAVMWVSALPTLLSAAAVLGVMFLMVGFARAGRRGWWRVPVMAVLTFVAACLNEQPVAGVMVLPALFSCVADERWSVRGWVRALVPAAACGAAGLVYVWLLNATAPVGFRGSTETFVSAGDAPGRVVDFAGQVLVRLGLGGYGVGAWKLGIGAIGGAGWVGVGVGVAVGLAGAAWVMRPVGDDIQQVMKRRGWVALLGLAWFVAGWVPVVVVSVYPPDSRTRYWPCLGLMVVLAVVFEGLRAKLAARPPARLLLCGRAAAAVAMVAACVVLIGVQRGYRIRWEQDRLEGAQLREQVPSPAPFTLFQPLDVRTTGIRTGSRELDSRFHGWWWYLWSTRKFVQEVYGRDDVSAMYWQGSEGLPYVGGDERGMRYSVRLGPRYGEREGEGSRLPWDRVVPFVIDESGRVRLVTEIVVGDGLRVRPAQTQGQAEFAVRLERK